MMELTFNFEMIRFGYQDFAGDLFTAGVASLAAYPLGITSFLGGVFLHLSLYCACDEFAFLPPVGWS